jgi:hypothetical protein
LAEGARPTSADLSRPRSSRPKGHLNVVKRNAGSGWAACACGDDYATIERQRAGGRRQISRREVNGPKPQFLHAFKLQLSGRCTTSVCSLAPPMEALVGRDTSKLKLLLQI